MITFFKVVCFSYATSICCLFVHKYVRTDLNDKLANHNVCGRDGTMRKRLCGLSPYIRQFCHRCGLLNDVD